MARDYSPFTPDSRDSGFGHSSQDEMRLFHMATAAPGSLSIGAGGGGYGRRDANEPQDDDAERSAIVIVDEMTNPDPEALDEMERKKERILLQSMKRKQELEIARQQKEMEALQRKEEERAKEEEKQRKKEEEKARRAIIYEQYKIKKAREEAEKEVTRLFSTRQPAKTYSCEISGTNVRDAGQHGHVQQDGRRAQDALQVGHHDAAAAEDDPRRVGRFGGAERGRRLRLANHVEPRQARIQHEPDRYRARV